MKCFHEDDLGSIAMITEARGAVVERMAYDPFIQSPLESQSYNRYAYVMNQPMNRTDPTGYFSFGKIFVGHMKAGDKVGAAVFSHFMTPVTLPFGRGFSTNYHTAYTFLAGPNGYQIKSFAIGIVSIFCYAGAPACYAGMTYALNRGYGAGHHEARKKADIAFISGTAFQLAGMVNSEMVNGVDQGANTYGRYAAHAAAGCVSAVAGGGKCGQGAVSAVFGKFASNAISSYGGNDVGSIAARGAMTVIAGGIGAELAGGKFVNGAKTAAMGYLYNEVSARLGASYGQSWSSGEDTAGCMSPTLACQARRDEVYMNGLRSGDLPIEGVYPDLVLGGAAAMAGKIAAIAAAPIKTGLDAFVGSGVLSLGVNSAMSIGLGEPFNPVAAGLQAAANGYVGVIFAPVLVTTSITFSPVVTKVGWGAILGIGNYGTGQGIRYYAGGAKP